ncbi:MAG: PepSY domain-containing protein [Rhodanobacteraceae bacterium]|nr:PepSY domain-containing protein [Rhodanobacteraceae bacterium]
MSYRNTFIFALALAGAAPVFATGLATCDSGDKAGWQSTEVLQKQLTDKGWTVRRIKEDGGCYEVYALDEKGARVEAYFHPVTLAPVPTAEHH